MSGHTTGPWVVDPEEPVLNTPPRIYADGKLICEVGNAESYSLVFEEWQANAHLIASAPALRAALAATTQIIAEYLASTPVRNPFCRKFNEQIEANRSVLGLAEKETTI